MDRKGKDKTETNAFHNFCRRHNDSLSLCIIDIIMEIVSLIVALGALAFTLYTYLKHDKELKAQQKFINEYEIERIKKEVVVEKKADVRAYMTDRRSGSYSGTLVIKNHGKAPAYNINMQYLPRKSYTSLPDQEIQELLPGADKEYPVFLGWGKLNVSVRLTWTDASGQQECQCPLL